MSYIFYNPNPRGRFVGDCVIRAVCKVTHQDWRTVHADLSDLSDEMCNNMCADEVWGEYLLQRGFTRHSVRNTCPYCYTVRRFCEDHPYGHHMLKTSGHVVAVINGNYYDTFDSGNDAVMYYLSK